MTTILPQNLRNSLSRKGSTCDQGWNFGLVEGHLKRAQAVLVRARSLAERSFGVSHALYLILMFEARVLDRLNQKAEAKQLRRRAQTMSRNKSPRDPTPFVIDIEDLRRR
jgi:hypothetical protein